MLSDGSACRRSASTNFARIEANLAYLSDQAGGPSVHVVFANIFAHPVHAHLLFFGAHLESSTDCLGCLIDIVGIDLQRISQFPRRAREAAQDEHPSLVTPRGDEFLCDEVHSIVQRGHKAQISGAVIRKDFMVIMMPFQKNYRPPPISLELPVDALRLGLHFGLKIVVALDMRAARCANLHEREDTLIAGILLQESFHREEALQNSFCLIEPVDPDTHQGSLDP